MPTPPIFLDQHLLDALWSQRKRILDDLSSAAPHIDAAFAVRCARRVQPLYDLPLEHPLRRSYVGILENALDTLDLLVSARLYHGRLSDDLEGALRSAVHAAVQAAHDAVSVAESAPYESFPEFAIANAAAKAALHAAMGSANDAADAADYVAREISSRNVDGSDLRRAMCFDLHRAQIFASAPTMEIPSPLAKSGPFGPLFPFGAPQWYWGMSSGAYVRIDGGTSHRD